jgi:hypothetical protein
LWVWFLPLCKETIIIWLTLVKGQQYYNPHPLNTDFNMKFAFKLGKLQIRIEFAVIVAIALIKLLIIVFGK